MVEPRYFEVGQVLDLSKCSEWLTDIQKVNDPKAKFTVVEIIHDSCDWIKIQGDGKTVKFSNRSIVAEKARIIPQLFLWQNPGVMAVIRARSSSEALRILITYEGEGDRNLAFSSTTADFTRLEVGGPEAVLAYEVDDSTDWIDTQGGKRVFESRRNWCIVAKDGSILLQIFVRKGSIGMAVIRAKSPKAALELLRAHEDGGDGDKSLASDATIADFTRVSVDGWREAVLAYVLYQGTEYRRAREAFI